MFKQGGKNYGGKKNTMCVREPPCLLITDLVSQIRLFFLHDAELMWFVSEMIQEFWKFT